MVSISVSIELMEILVIGICSLLVISWCIFYLIFLHKDKTKTNDNDVKDIE